MKRMRADLIPSNIGRSKLIENPLSAELADMKIQTRATSYDPKKRDLYAMRKPMLPLRAEKPHA